MLLNMLSLRIIKKKKKEKEKKANNKLRHNFYAPVCQTDEQQESLMQPLVPNSPQILQE